jgi:Na+/citrate or Na+/malate symporter
MKFPLIIASDFSGALESLVLVFTFLALVPLSLLSVIFSFVGKRRTVTRKLVYGGAAIVALQALTLISFLAAVPTHSREDIQFGLLLLLHPLLLGFAYWNSREPDKKV